MMFPPRVVRTGPPRLESLLCPTGELDTHRRKRLWGARKKLIFKLCFQGTVRTRLSSSVIKSIDSAQGIRQLPLSVFFQFADKETELRDVLGPSPAV